MKKNAFLLLNILLVCLSAVSFSCSSDKEDEVENLISYEDLPSTAKDFLNNYFYGYEIEKVLEINADNVSVFQVYLTEGYEIVFNKNGIWDQIDAPYGKTIPMDVIPEPIRQTLNEQYHGYGVIEINRDGENFHVQLSDNQGGMSIDLIFNQSGEIIPDS